MTPIEHLKTKCPRCRTTIEFPKHGLGQQVPCPTCQWIITLKKPFPKTVCAIAIFCGLLVVAGAVAVIARKPHPNTTQSTAVSTYAGHQSETPRQTEPGEEGIQDNDPLLIAANRGDAVAQYQIGSKYYIHQNYTDAVKWWTKAADQGNEEAEANLGHSYYYGEGVSKDYAEAVKWSRAAAEKGEPLAQITLGNAYYYGQGLPQNYTEAVNWYRKGAEQGYAAAEKNLGECYQDGQGVPQDFIQAVKWYRKSAGQGEVFGAFALARCYASGIGIAADNVEAYKWFQFALKQKYDGPNDYREQMVIECANVKRALIPEQIQEADKAVAAFVPGTPVKEAPSESTEPILFREETGHFEIRVERILKGQRVFDEGLIYPSQMDSPQKEIVYFEVSVKNISGEQEHNLWHFAFTLEDSEGNSYSSEQPKDYIRGAIHIGKTGRGGIAFQIYKGHRPTKLVYDTGEMIYNSLTGGNTGIKVFATASLQNVSLFQNSFRPEQQAEVKEDTDTLLIAANRGDPAAQWKVGSNYFFQVKNYAESAKWWRKAANQGNVEAQTYLGILYDQGEGIAQDVTESVKWWRKAALQGNSHAQILLGASYQEGRGVAKDYAEAVKWYRAAANQGSAGAQLDLGDCYMKGKGVTKDYAEAANWIQKAADQGDADAQAALGMCYDEGKGVRQDYAKAVEWYRKAAEQGHAAAEFNLGGCYENGQGVAKDYAEAFKWYRQAAQGGDAKAQYNLACCYVNGVGVVRDYVMADAWLNLSAAQGDMSARKMLPQVEQRMTRADIAEGQRHAREFQARNAAQ
jgi:uncharacterized protein